MTRTMTRRMLGAGLLISLGLYSTGCSAIAELGPMADAGQAFMKSMKDADHEASFRMLAKALQEKIGGQEGWDAFCEPRVPTEWSFSNRNIENSQGHLSGSVKMANGQSLNVELTLVKEDNLWKLTGVRFAS